MGIIDTFNTFVAVASTLGYLGLFAVSFIASVIVFVPIPFFPLLALMSIDKEFDPHLLALSSALGATVAKTIIFYASFHGRRLISKEGKVKMKPLQRLLKRYGWYASFIAAATPIPDDLIYIPLGLAKFSPWLFFTSCLAGKIAISEAIVWSVRLGFNILEYVESSADTSLLYATITATVIAAVAMVYFMIKVDWGILIGKIFPWTLYDSEDNSDDSNNKHN